MTSQAELADVEKIVPLFDAYRFFYGRESNVEAARQFLTENLTAKLSTIIIHTKREQSHVITGFVQLYPSRCSLSLSKIYILYDLYVAENFRRQGIAKELLKHAKQFALESGASRIELQTAPSNVAAKELYDSQGYKVDNFTVYTLDLKGE